MRHYCRFNKKIGLMLGAVSEGATGDAFAISNGFVTEEIKEKIEALKNEGRIDVAYNDQLGYLALMEK